MKFRYKNTEKRMHGGKRVIRTVNVAGNKGFKSVTFQTKTKKRTVKKPLSDSEISRIKRKKFIVGLFDDCHTKYPKN
jgi:hypothetical protein